MNPRLTFSFVSAAFLALAATGLVIKTDPVVAQQASEVLEEVVVEAPITTVREVRWTSRDAAMRIIELKQRVSYADLDLSKSANVIEFEVRVETIAKESCDKLSAMYPLPQAGTTERERQRRCISEAINGAKGQVQAAIVAAS